MGSTSKRTLKYYVVYTISHLLQETPIAIIDPGNDENGGHQQSKPLLVHLRQQYSY